MDYPWDIIGHEPVLRQLEREIQTGNLASAYLFSGPRQTGKFRIARTFAVILQCPNGFCQTCRTCKAVPAGTHPDVCLMKDEGQSLGIDQVRELISKANLTSQSPYRIFLIENIERMPLEAQNSFLKILEEPPGRTLFLLTSSRPNDVLPTIHSRVRNYAFFNIGYEALKGALEKQFENHGELDEIINIAQGRPGLAITLLKNPEQLEEQRRLYARIDAFLKHNNLAEKFLFVEAMLDENDEGRGLELFFDAFTRYLRKLLFEYIEEESHPLKNRWGALALVTCFESLERTRRLVEHNANKRLALENFLISTER